MKRVEAYVYILPGCIGNWPRPFNRGGENQLLVGNWFSQGLIGFKVNFIIRKTPDGQTRRVKSSKVEFTSA